MAKKTPLKAAPRARTGSGLLKQMRREGWLPSVIYGRGTENLNLKVDAKTFKEVISNSASENIVVNLDIEGEGTRLAFLQDVTHDPLSGNAIHADFLAIDENTEIHGQVPAVLIGEAPGVKAGGVVEQYVHDIEIKSKASMFPGEIEFDISKLELGDSLHIGEATFPEGISPAQGDDVVIVHIGRAGSGDAGASATEEEAEPAEAAS